MFGDEQIEETPAFEQAELLEEINKEEEDEFAGLTIDDFDPDLHPDTWIDDGEEDDFDDEWSEDDDYDPSVVREPNPMPF